MIILVTGSRYATYDVHGLAIRRTLAWIAGGHRTDPNTELWDGSADGVDAVARRIATDEFAWTNRPFAANWPECDPSWTDPLTKRAPCQAAPLVHRGRRYDGSDYCPTAGFRRNQMMVDQLLLAQGRKVCVAFPIPELGSNGTADCLTRAWRSRIATVVIPLDAP